MYHVVIKGRFTQFNYIVGFFTRLHVYFKKAVQKLPELAIKIGAAVFSALGYVTSEEQ